MIELLLNKNVKEIDSDFYKKIINFIEKEENITKEFEENCNFAYIGEIAERFIERKFIKTPEELTTLNIILGYKSFKLVDFQINQQRIYLNNNFKWIKENNISGKEKKSLLSSLCYYFGKKVYQFDNEENETLKEILNELKTINEDISFFDICCLFDLYNVLLSYGSNKDTNLIDITKEVIINMLNDINMDLKSLDFNFLISTIKLLYYSKKENILNLLDLKVKNFKNNKNNLNILKAFKKLSFNELKEEDLIKMQPTLDLTILEISVLNKMIAGDEVSYSARDRIKEIIIKNYLLEKELPNEFINNYVLSSNNIYAKDVIKKFVIYYNNVTNIEIFKLLMENHLKENLVSSFDVSTINKILKDEKKRSLLNDKQLQLAANRNLNVTLNQKEDFDFILELVKSNNIVIEKERYYYYNLIKFNYIDILDLDYILKNDLLETVIDYLESVYGKLGAYAYVTKLDVEEIFDFSNKFSLYNFKNMYYYKNSDLKNIALLLNFTNDNDLSDEEYKEILYKEILEKLIEIECRYNPTNFVDNLYNILKNEKFSIYLKFSDEEILEIKKFIFENKLVGEEELEELKFLFLTDEEILKVKTLKGIKELESNVLDFNRYSKNKFILFLRDYEDVIFKETSLQELFLEKLKEKLDLERDLYNWSEYSKLYFNIYNLDESKNFANKVFSIINNYYLTISNK